MRQDSQLRIMDERKDKYPALQNHDYEGFFQRYKLTYVASESWKKVLTAFWRELKMRVSPNDVEELTRVLRDKRASIAKDCESREFYLIWKSCFDLDKGDFDCIKFIYKWNFLCDGHINQEELDGFFSWYCLTKTIDDLLTKIIHEKKNAPGHTTKFFFNINGDIHFGTPASAEEDHEEGEEEDLLKNLIFNERLFDTNRKLIALRSTIAAAIDTGDASIIYGTPQEMRINPGVQGEWYYIVKAIEEARVGKNNFAVTSFIDQMLDWYPTVFSIASSDEWNKYKRHLAKSISEEKRLWRYGKAKTIITLQDMWAKRKYLQMEQAKMERIYSIAYTGLYKKLVDLKQRMDKEKSQQ
ncbi:MAG TPA: hypothetical protein H9824_04025 [Candidatus Bacteroides pullicola]|uniref:Uncharacterized protein n=1 Tax=Candidatus Bacteroides pullicola TaxID=2838475 RepID=A0A9D1ZGQ9_9BACE|nr:hypothetical protein [Candidatus Bacteroides pullicola]